MNKLNKTKQIIIFIFIFFSFVLNNASAATVWGYKEILTTKPHGDYTSLEECKAQRDAFLKSVGFAIAVTECTSSVSALPVVTTKTETDIKTDEPVNVSAAKQPVNLSNDTYKFLAPIGSETDVKTTNIGSYINTIIKTVIGISAALAVIMIILAGIQMMGDESVFGKVEAKSKIGAAVLGLLIALGSYALLNTLNPDLLGKKGLAISGVNIELESEPLPWSTYSSGGNLTLCPEGFEDVGTFDLTNSKINVCKVISVDLRNLISKAKTDGLRLSGYGSRSIEQQRSLRVKNKCPDIDNSIAEACNPPTARPGRSMHETGKAIDFRCNGQSMMESGGKNSVCYKWLASNAGTYGLKNLGSESWHWSTTGN